MVKNKMAFLILFVALATVLLILVDCGNADDVVCQRQTISSGSYQLDAEIVFPKNSGKFPCLVIVPGSGSVDMDGTIGLQKPYKNLTYQLAKKALLLYVLTKLPTSMRKNCRRQQILPLTTNTLTSLTVAYLL